jgi:hypothetical protein
MQLKMQKIGQAKNNLKSHFKRIWLLIHANQKIKKLEKII